MSGELASIRELGDDDELVAFGLLRLLREHLDLPEFRRRLAAQRTLGYRLWGAVDEGNLLGAIGWRQVTTLARGNHLHVDDLVVAPSARGTGLGKRLMSFAHEFAEANACEWVFLDSRQEVTTFYASLGYAPHSAILMRKPIHQGR